MISFISQDPIGLEGNNSIFMRMFMTQIYNLILLGWNVRQQKLQKK